MMIAVAASCLVGVTGWAASSASARTFHFEITISVSGPGHVTGSGDGGSFNCPDSCSALIRERTLLTLTATPDEGSQFSGWGGSCVEYGTDPTCTVQISGPKDITAGFGAPPPPTSNLTLTLLKDGTGSGYVGGGGIDCGPICSASFGQNAQVMLLAVPDDGSSFVGWTGGGCSGTDQCTVTVTSAVTVTAVFDHIDRDPPHLRTIPVTAARGTIAKLRFRVYDDSKHSRELLTILRGGKVPVGRVTVPLQDVHYRQIYEATWPVPKSMSPGKHLWCGVATDLVGNATKRSCSLLRVT